MRIFCIFVCICLFLFVFVCIRFFLSVFVCFCSFLFVFCSFCLFVFFYPMATHLYAATTLCAREACARQRVCIRAEALWGCPRPKRARATSNEKKNQNEHHVRQKMAKEGGGRGVACPLCGHAVHSSAALRKCVKFCFLRHKCSHRCTLW